MSSRKTGNHFVAAFFQSKVTRWTIAGGCVLAACLVFFAKPLSTAVLKRVINYRLSGMVHEFEDGLHAGLCGTGSPLADIKRAGPCIAVVAGKHLYIVDSGDGSTKNINLMGFQAGNIDAVLLTHFHSDHIAGLGELMLQRWAGGSNKLPLDIIGPEGVETVVDGFNKAYSLDTGYRIAHHSPEVMPASGAGGLARPYTLGPEEDASAVVVDTDGVKITAFKVDHRPIVPAVGYRFDYKGRSLVISGDTVYSPSLRKHANGADLLFHEALSPWMVKLIHEQARFFPFPSLQEVTEVIPSYHASPEDAAKIAGEANVAHLVLYHIIPPLPSPLLNSLFLGNAKTYYKGPVTMGVDGMLFGLPANSKEIILKTIL
ncbi:MAG: MBL fold metallo-hydrolase [Desulfobacteraceae bacterium]|nr:MAG: MBL fold metallo-hydrolase [Desulfobacteraceae bacterium]